MSQSKAKPAPVRKQESGIPPSAKSSGAAAACASFVEGLRAKAVEAKTGTTVSLAGLSDDELIAALRR